LVQIFFSEPCSQTSSVYALPLAWDHVSHPGCMYVYIYVYYKLMRITCNITQYHQQANPFLPDCNQTIPDTYHNKAPCSCHSVRYVGYARNSKHGSMVCYGDGADLSRAWNWLAEVISNFNPSVQKRSICDTVTN
jgi:hypothetical protein